MFHYISGALTLLTPTFAVLDAGGVGFKLTVSATDVMKHKTSVIRAINCAK